MKIAQVSPLFERVPPRAYGGTERIISYLTEELVRRGHDVTLFASGDSLTSAELVSPVDSALRMDTGRPCWLAYYAMQLDQLAQRAHEFDIIHFHTEHMHFPLARSLRVPHLTTVHGRLDLPELVPLFRQFRACPLVSISHHQRTPLPQANWSATIHHGLPHDMYALNEHSGDYFAFIGRISPEKRVDRAIAIARACGKRLYVAAKIDKLDEPYFKAEIEPLFADPLVEYVGEVGDREKRALLENARALLFPIDWPEPFGLVMIEAFACGTPVIAWRNGAIPEIVEDGVTGFVVDNMAQAIHAAQSIDEIDRRACRDAFENRFTVAAMTDNYLHAYERQIDAGNGIHVTPRPVLLARRPAVAMSVPPNGDPHG